MSSVRLSPGVSLLRNVHTEDEMGQVRPIGPYIATKLLLLKWQLSLQGDYVGSKHIE